MIEINQGYRVEFHYLFIQLFSFLLLTALVISPFVLLIKALRRCFRNESDSRLTAWIIVIIALPVLGPILYLTDKSKKSSDKPVS